MGSLFPLTHTHTHFLPRFPFSEKPLEPIALAYLLCIIGCSVPEDWLGRHERPEEKGESWEGDKAQFCSERRGCCSGSKVPHISVVMTLCVCLHEAVVTNSSQAEIGGYFENQTGLSRHYTTLSAPLIRLLLDQRREEGGRLPTAGGEKLQNVPIQG